MKRLILTICITLFMSGCVNDTDDNTPRAFLGGENAPILIQEFSDFECPACATVSPMVEEFARNNPNLVRFEYYHFPLNQHKYAFIAAEASECATNQGKFWEYMGMLFQNQKKINEDFLITVAEELNLDMTLFESCLNNHDKKARVKNDRAAGLRKNVSFTPSLYVNGQLVKWSDPETFEIYIKSLVQ